MIRVAVDVRRATWRPELGISRSTRALLREITRIAPSDVHVVAIDAAGRAALPHLEDRIEIAGGSDFLHRLYQEQLAIPRSARRVDLLHLPWSEGPFVAPCPLVVSIYDLDTLEFAAAYRWRFRAYYNSLLRVHVRRARRIIVPSEATRRALEARWPGRPYVVVPLAVDPVFSAEADGGSGDPPYVLYTGGFAPRKRLPDLFAAFDEVAGSEPDVRLVITGDPPADVLRAARASPTGGRVSFTGRVSDTRLSELYRGARVVAYPSALEGFGFPVLEGFASGTPVVAANGGSIPEIAGGAALLVPVGRPKILADALLSVLRDRQLARRLAAAGNLRVRDFSWTESARRTLDVYRDAVG